MKISFKSTQHKIALIFALISGALILFTTIVVIFYVRFSLDNNAKTLLMESLSKNVEDFEAGDLEEKNVQYKKDTKQTEEYQESNILPNLRSQKEIYDDKLNSKDELVNIIDEDTNLTDLEKQKGIFSRVIQENGDILITSELFETFYVNPEKLGFHKYSDAGTCIYAYTEKISSGTNQGNTVQVADYCTFTQKEEKNLYYIMSGIGILAIFLAYIFGFIYALLILKPLKKSVEKTKQFTQDCYHELLTPISVAMSTVESKKRTKKYREGLLSVEDDLRKTLDSLDILKSKALIDRSNYILQKINIDEVLEEAIKNQLSTSRRQDIIIEKNISPTVTKKTDSRCIRIIFINLINNALKYTKENGKIIIKLDKNIFSINNEVENIQDKNIQKWINRNVQGKNGKDGAGVGLSIVRELTQEMEWKIDISHKDNIISIRIKF